MILRLLIANALELAVGVGIVSALRLPLGTAYLAGLGRRLQRSRSTPTTAGRCGG